MRYRGPVLNLLILLILKQKFSFRLRFPYELLKNERREKKTKKKTVVAIKTGLQTNTKMGRR